MYIFISKNKSGSKHFETGDVSASKHFSKCDKRCHLMDRCRVWLSSAVGRKRDHGDESLLPFHTLVRGEATAWPERCFCHLDSPGTCSFGSESRSLATHPHLGEKRKSYTCSGYLTISNIRAWRGGKLCFFLGKKTNYQHRTQHGLVSSSSQWPASRGKTSVGPGVFKRVTEIFRFMETLIPNWTRGF